MRAIPTAFALCLVLVALGSCSSSSGSSSSSAPVKNEAGYRCTSASECAEPNSTCPWGTCTAACTTDGDCAVPAAAGSKCVNFAPPNLDPSRTSSKVCCPPEGCHAACSQEQAGQEPCTTASQCGCSNALGTCAKSATTGESRCYKLCSKNSDFKSGCCNNSIPGKAVDTGNNVSGCVDAKYCGGSTGGDAGTVTCKPRTLYCDVNNGATGPWLCFSGGGCDARGAPNVTCQIADVGSSPGTCVRCNPSCTVMLDANCNHRTCL